MQCTLGIFVSAALVCFAGCQEWSYDDADRWKDDFPQCGEKDQSPIEVKTSEANMNILDIKQLKESGDRYKLAYYEMPISGTLSNTGLVLELAFTETDPEKTPFLAITQNGETTKYLLKSLELHHPSEHLWEGNRYNAEIHLIHRDSANNTVVVLFFYRICRLDSGSIKILLNGIDDLMEPGTKIDVQPFAASILTRGFARRRRKLSADNTEEITGENVCGVLKYSGTMVRPPCTPVTYFVLVDYLPCMTEDQVNKLKKLKDRYGYFSDTYRPEQPLNDRKIDNIVCKKKS